MRYLIIFLLLFLSCSHSLFTGLPKQERVIVEAFDGLAHVLMDSGYAVAIGRGVSAREGLSKKEARLTGRAALLDVVDSVLQDLHRQAEELWPEKMDSLESQEVSADRPNDPTDLGLAFAEMFEVMRSECVTDKQERTVCYALVRVEQRAILSYFKQTHELDDVSVMIYPDRIKALYHEALIAMLEPE
ncbi:MAG: hypothetical protein U5R06_14940 [candidate division KSB1 bacterium]|nr:hypothetical protein [candidate division KSB1 bacterium]